MTFPFYIQDVFSLFFGECILIYSVLVVLGYNIYYTGKITKEENSGVACTHTGTLFLVFIGLVFFLLTLLVSNQGNSYHYYGEFFHIGPMENLVLASVVILSLIILLLSKSYLELERVYTYEYYVLYLLYVTGVAVLMKSINLISVYLGIEIVGLTSYALSSYKYYSEYSIEASLKYFVVGALGSAFLLFGSSLLYLAFGTLDVYNLSICLKYSGYAIRDIQSLQSISTIGVMLVLLAFLLKLGVVPFHVWVPDVYEGSPTIVTMVFSTLSKIVFFTFLAKLFISFLSTCDSFLIGVLQTLCLLSILVGTLLALFQTRVKRFFAYSSIVHAGYLLLVLLNQTVLNLSIFFFYMIFYIVPLVGIFSLILSYRVGRSNVRVKYLSELSGLWKIKPVVSVGLTVLLCSLAGIPPLVGFLSKFYVLLVLLRENLFLLPVLLVILSVVGVVYYLYLIRITYFGSTHLTHKDLFISTTSAYFFSFSVCFLIVGIFYAEEILCFCNVITYDLVI